MADEKLALLKVLMNDELRIGELYKIYSSKFPVYKQFWARLAEQEMAHADNLRFLYEKAEAGEINFSTEKFNLMAMTAFSGYLSRLITEADSGIVTVKGAAAIASDVEKALIEKKAFELFITGDQVFISIMKKISSETEEHMRACKELFQQIEG